MRVLSILQIVLLIVLVAGTMLLPSFGHPTAVGGDYGRTWLTNYGNKNIIPQSTGLWDWGIIPKGHVLSNGRLTELGSVTLIYPAFPTSANPIVLNETTPIQAITSFNATQLNNPALWEDPWTIAQINGRPVLYRTLPY